MSDHIKQTIADLQGELQKQEAAVLDTKRLINMLCGRAGMTPMYADADLQQSAGVALSIKSDQFYGQPMVTAIRQILEMRRALKQEPATINELYDSLIKGGFAFDTKNEDNAKRGIRISVTKNSGIFHKIPNGGIGLLDWYPSAKSKANRRAAAIEDAADNEEEDPTS